MNAVDALALLVLPAVADSAVRIVLTLAARRASPPALAPVRDWVALIPSRGEGKALEPTLASMKAGAEGSRVRVIVILDGPDEVASSIASAYGAEIIVKSPGGPAKGAALAWFASTCPNLLGACEAVALFDVGSRVTPRFFEEFRWPEGCAAVQCVIAGDGSGVGVAIAQSESFGQSVEDVGRQALGWSVRLRGTGCAFRPDRFLGVALRLRTQVEDLEASLLLAADGDRIGRAPAGPMVIDEKPREVGAAAAQRARWLAGTLMLALQRGVTLATLCSRRPLEGLAFVAQLFGRPLSLTGPLRLVIASIILLAGGSGSVGRLALPALIVASVVSDLFCLRVSAPLDVGSAARLVLAWLRAVPMIPMAALRWLRAGRSKS